MLPTRRFLTNVSFIVASAFSVLLGTSEVSRADRAETATIERGRIVYAQQCAHCHGAEGKGDGAAAVNFPLKAQDLTDGRVMNPLPDHFLFKVISQGGQAVGLSPLMPGLSPHLSDAQIRDAIAYVRTLASPPFDPHTVLPVPTERDGPTQPIFFSHLIHAGSFHIDCLYCHAGARRGSAAGIPSVERCMGCHKIIAAQGNPEVQKLHGYWERKESIPWVRVFKVPEYVRFPHKNHVQAGLPCQTCHGRIEAMEQVHADTGQRLVNDLKNLLGLARRPPLLTMGWCVECHTAVNANNLERLSWIGSPVPRLASQDPKAPVDCFACHH